MSLTWVLDCCGEEIQLKKYEGVLENQREKWLNTPSENRFNIPNGTPLDIQTDAITNHKKNI